jgi:predicted nucleic acid-binding protein
MVVKSILDTDILSEYLKGLNPTVARHAARYAQQHQITPINEDYLAAGTIRAIARKQGIALELPECLVAFIAYRSSTPFRSGATWAATRDWQHERL